MCCCFKILFKNKVLLCFKSYSLLHKCINEIYSFCFPAYLLLSVVFGFPFRSIFRSAAAEDLAVECLYLRLHKWAINLFAQLEVDAVISSVVGVKNVHIFELCQFTSRFILFVSVHHRLHWLNSVIRYIGNKLALWKDFGIAWGCWSSVEKWPRICTTVD